MRSFVLLTLLGCYLAACNSSQKNIQPKPQTAAVPALSATLVEKQLNGVDFFARGSYPATWSVEMDFGNLIRFKAIDGNEANASSVQPVYLPEQKATSFSSAGNVQVMLYDESCKDAASGEVFSKRVTVRVKDKLYEGCGQYLFDAQLNGKWRLVKVNGKPVNTGDFAKGSPLLNLDLRQQTINGHDGCNQLSGGFEVMGSKIRFMQLVQTEMACPGNPSGFQFAPLISGQTIDYYFKEGQLHLYLQDDSILIFAKA